MTFVARHPHLDRLAFASQLGDVFSHVDTLGDLLRQIGHDERTHKLESLREAAHQPVMTPASLTQRERVVILLGLTVLSLLAALAERLDERERRRRTTPTAVRAEASRETTTTRRLPFRIKP